MLRLKIGLAKTFIMVANGLRQDRKITMASKIYPIITKSKQELYEKIYTEHPDLEQETPEICGYYGRACRRMDGEANRMLCQGCTLSIFVSTVEAIVKTCDEKEAIGIERLYDSDMYDIQDSLERKCIHVNFSYIEKVLDYLVKG